MDLVTGATGIVGSHVLLECARLGPVRAIHRGTADRTIVDRIFRFYRDDAEELLARIEWHEAGLEDTDALHEAMVGVRHVFHAAAVVSFDPQDAKSMDRVNVQGTANVVNAALAHNVERLCHVSSTATIGSAPSDVLRNEDLPWTTDRHTSGYALSKYAAELEVHRGIAEGLDAVMVNPCVIIGPGAAGRSSMTLMERLQKGTGFYPPGSNAVVDARDVARCMMQLVEQGKTGQRYLLVGENLSYRTLFTELAHAFGRPAPHCAIRPWMLELGWRIERLRSLLTGSKPFLTAATANSAITKRSYEASKVRQLLDHDFISAKDAVENVARFLRGDRAH